MSWDQYCDTSLCSTGMIKHSYILGKDGSVYGKSGGAPQLKGIPQTVADVLQFQKSGTIFFISLNGQNYVIEKYLQQDKGNCILLKNTKDNSGAVIAITIKLIIIAFWDGNLEGANGKRQNSFDCFTIARNLQKIMYDSLY